MLPMTQGIGSKRKWSTKTQMGTGGQIISAAHCTKQFLSFPWYVHNRGTEKPEDVQPVQKKYVAICQTYSPDTALEFTRQREIALGVLPKIM